VDVSKSSQDYSRRPCFQRIGAEAEKEMTPKKNREIDQTNYWKAEKSCTTNHLQVPQRFRIGRRSGLREKFSNSNEQTIERRNFF